MNLLASQILSFLQEVPWRDWAAWISFVLVEISAGFRLASKRDSFWGPLTNHWFLGGSPLIRNLPRSCLTMDIVQTQTCYG